MLLAAVASAATQLLAAVGLPKPVVDTVARKPLAEIKST